MENSIQRVYNFSKGKCKTNYITLLNSTKFCVDIIFIKNEQASVQKTLFLGVMCEIAVKGGDNS